MISTYKFPIQADIILYLEIDTDTVQAHTSRDGYVEPVFLGLGAGARFLAYIHFEQSCKGRYQRNI